jgi:hypothetical protein
MRILILPSARDDLSDEFEFYERQQAGLGDYFRESKTGSFFTAPAHSWPCWQWRGLRL